MPVFQTPGPIVATVDVGAGAVRVVASDRADTVVDVRPHNPGREKDVEAAEQVAIDFAGGRLTVRTPRKWLRSLIGAGPAVDVDVELPADSELDVRAWSRVSSAGRLGRVTVENAAGDVRVEHATESRIKVPAGDVAVGRLDGPGEVTVSAGGVRIDEVAGSVVVKVATGESSIGEVTGDLRLSSSYGDIRIGRVLGAVDARTAYGSVRVADAVSGTVALDTNFGDLDIGVADGTAAWLAVSSKNGVVNSELVATDTPTDGRTVEIRARTQFGDLTVRRA